MKRLSRSQAHSVAARMALSTILLGGLVACGPGQAGNAGARAAPMAPPKLDAPLAPRPGEQTAVFAGGCFWGVEAVFEHLKGVKRAESGYAGGTPGTANYDAVSSGRTGHAEAVKVVYDPSRITYGQLLQVFFSVAHDPTQLNRQGPDRGPQYRSALFTRNAEQQRVARAYIAQLGAARAWPRPIVTTVAPLRAFHPAEAHHQDYMRRNPDQPYIVHHDAPKLVALKREFPALYAGR